MKPGSTARLLSLTLALALHHPAHAHAQDLASFEHRITTKVLPNGLTLILCERPDAPVFSYYTIVDAGDANDPGGDSGLAHMFEHLAFKGTEDIGTKRPMPRTTPNCASAWGRIRPGLKI
jgi:predicted Zn-dependent peptidase